MSLNAGTKDLKIDVWFLTMMRRADSSEAYKASEDSADANSGAVTLT